MGKDGAAAGLRAATCLENPQFGAQVVFEGPESGGPSLRQQDGKHGWAKLCRARLLWGLNHPQWVLPSGSGGRATAGAAWQCLFVPVV